MVKIKWSESSRGVLDAIVGTTGAGLRVSVWEPRRAPGTFACSILDLRLRGFLVEAGELEPRDLDGAKRRALLWAHDLLRARIEADSKAVRQLEGAVEPRKALR